MSAVACTDRFASSRSLEKRPVMRSPRKVVISGRRKPCPMAPSAPSVMMIMSVRSAKRRRARRVTSLMPPGRLERMVFWCFGSSTPIFFSSSASSSASFVPSTALRRNSFWMVLVVSSSNPREGSHEMTSATSYRTPSTSSFCFISTSATSVPPRAGAPAAPTGPAGASPDLTSITSPEFIVQAQRGPSKHSQRFATQPSASPQRVATVATRTPTGAVSFPLLLARPSSGGLFVIAM
mmetsp:Transcript_19293/g.44847  ORF Transcript_19293/g.44847 Transcript_19293/m.44847 type:complete len:237 (-) Transcript_19293:29-739(-)